MVKGVVAKAKRKRAVAKRRCASEHAKRVARTQAPIADSDETSTSRTTERRRRRRGLSEEEKCQRMNTPLGPAAAAAGASAGVESMYYADGDDYDSSCSEADVLGIDADGAPVFADPHDADLQSIPQGYSRAARAREMLSETLYSGGTLAPENAAQASRREQVFDKLAQSARGRGRRSELAGFAALGIHDDADENEADMDMNAERMLPRPSQFGGHDPCGSSSDRETAQDVLEIYHGTQRIMKQVDRLAAQNADSACAPWRAQRPAKQSTLRQDADQVLDDHMYQYTGRAQESFTFDAIELLKTRDVRHGARSTTIPQGGERWHFSMRERILGGLFSFCKSDDMIRHMCVHCPDIENFALRWAPFCHVPPKDRSVNSLFFWKCVIRDSSGHVETEQYMSGSNTYVIQVALRKFKPGQFEDIVDKRKEMNLSEIPKEDFAAFAKDSIRAQISFAVEPDSVHGVVELGALKRAERANATASADQRASAFQGQRDPEQKRGNARADSFDVSRDLNDIELMEAQEEVQRKKNSRFATSMRRKEYHAELTGESNLFMSVTGVRAFFL